MAEDPTAAAKPPSAAFLELKRFGEEHARATLLLRVAAQDYAATRCLLLSRLLTGLVLGAQTIEKTLKAFLLLQDPKRNVRRLSHSLGVLCREVATLFPDLSLAQFEPLIGKFSRHYDTRYPDNPNASTSMTSADLFELDPFIVLLNENLPCPHVVKYRTGFYSFITFSLHYKATVTPTEFWIKNNNNALSPLWPRIAAEYIEVMRELHPETPFPI